MRVLVTLNDVEPAVRLNAMLEKVGYQTDMVSPLDDMRAAIRRSRPELILVTGNLADPANVQLAKQQLWDGAAVVGLSDVDEPILIARLRAAGYTEIFPKPVNLDEVFAGVRRIIDRRSLSRETGLIGESAAIREVLVKVEQMAPVSSTVLIEGESGSGKELVARAIHRRSPRRNKPFIAVNVGALPDSLLESELFGHEKGAFTGAAERRLGRFELAHTGTIFLDEIGEIPQSTQVKLLRVLEEREVTRVGGSESIAVDVRVVAATNRPLREHVEGGEFRSDLYYRLNVLRIYLPPLRERKEDIPLLVRKFVEELSAMHDRTFHGISGEAMQIMTQYAWPGNVRELRNLVESMVVLSPGREIEPADLPRHVQEPAGARFLPVHVGAITRATEHAGGTGRELEFIVRSLIELKLQVEELRRRMDDERERSDNWIGEVRSAPSAGRLEGAVGSSAGAIEPRGEVAPPTGVTIMPGMTMAEIEKAAIEAALKATGGNRRKAADQLGIGERTLYRKLREYQLEHTLTSIA